MTILILQFLTGIGIFLLGLNILSDNFATLINSNSKLTLKMTNIKGFGGYMSGLVSSLICQSSSAINSLCINLSNKKLILTTSAVFVLMGSNVGSTITPYIAVLSSINIASWFSSIVFLCVIISMITKKDTTKTICYILCGISLIFVGLGQICHLVDTFSTPIKLVLINTQNNYVLFVYAIIITGIFQSSSLITTILVAFAINNVLSLESACYIIMGSNIGTCTTPLLASIGKDKMSVALAYFNLRLNVIGSILFFVLIESGAFILLFNLLSVSIATKIALFHTFFNVLSTLFVFPLLEFVGVKDTYKDSAIPIL